MATLAVAATPKNANNKNAFEQDKILRTVLIMNYPPYYQQFTSLSSQIITKKNAYLIIYNSYLISDMTIKR